MLDDKSPQRRPLMVANWKMYKTPMETEAFIKEFLPSFPKTLKCDVVLCPPFTSLAVAAPLLAGSPMALGGQNLNENDEGAFTGEISGAMLAAIGCKYVIIGHSERRQFFGETDAGVNKKIQAALKHSLIPIVCVGESLAQREANQTLKVIESQVKGAFEGLPSAETRKVVLAYEPIWAIGTGKTATPIQAQEVHLKIRDILKDQYGSLTSLSIRVLYGGSIKPDNISELMNCEDIDGGLVGGSSLKTDSFKAIIAYESKKLAER